MTIKRMVYGTGAVPEEGYSKPYRPNIMAHSREGVVLPFCTVAVRLETPEPHSQLRKEIDLCGAKESS